MVSSLKSKIVDKLRKQAGVLRSIAGPAAFGAVSSLANTPEGSGLSYYGTNALKSGIEGAIFSSPRVPTVAKIGVMALNPLGNVGFLNRQDPRARPDYNAMQPSYERHGIS